MNKAVGTASVPKAALSHVLFIISPGLHIFAFPRSICLHTRQSPRFRTLQTEHPRLHHISCSAEPPQENKRPASPPFSSSQSFRTWFLGEEGEFDRDLRRLGTTRRRLLLGITFTSALSLGANFLGVTSALLGLLPEAIVRTTGIDSLYPVRGFKRYRSADYEMVVPENYLQDYAVALFQQAKKAKRLEYDMKRRENKVAPDVAFGPPGGTAQQNISVIKSEVPPGFSLRGTLGDPTEAAEKLIKTSLAPELSGKVATLVKAYDRNGDGSYYVMEFIIRPQSNVEVHAVNVIAFRAQDNTLFTVTAVVPQSKWDKMGDDMNHVAESFRVIWP